MKSFLVPVAGSLLLLAACGEAPPQVASARQPLEESLHLQRMLVLERPPIIAVQDPREMSLAIRAADGLDMQELERRPQARWSRTDALPFLTQTDAGRDFLAAAAPRALARGMPPEFCPALATAHGPDGAGQAEKGRAETRRGETGRGETGRGEVAQQALSRCLDQLGAGHEGCGCRLVALDDLVTVPRNETAYATGVSARLRVPALNVDFVLVAEEGPTGAETLRDLSGPVGRLSRQEDDRVTLDFEGRAGPLAGRHFDGRRIAVGFRRGRLAERIYATDAQGHRLSLLVGFEPDELAGSAAAWLAWPPKSQG